MVCPNRRLASLFFAFFHQTEKYGNDAGGDNKYGTNEQPQAKGLVEDHDSNDHTGNGFQCAEDGCAFAADEEGALLEQNNRAGRNQKRKQDTQSPTGSCGGKDERVGGNADAEGADRTHEDDVEGEQKTGNSGTVKTGKHDHIRGKGHCGKQGQDAAGEVESFLGRIEHTNAHGAEQNAEETAKPGLFPQEKDLADDDEGRVSEVKHGCWTGGDKLVGRKQQDRRQAAAQQGDQCDLWKQRKWDLQGFLLPVCQNAQRQEREHIAQKHKRERSHTIGIDIFCHQRHGTVNDCAYDGESASLQDFVTHEKSPPFVFFYYTNYTIRENVWRCRGLRCRHR